MRMSQALGVLTVIGVALMLNCPAFAVPSTAVPLPHAGAPGPIAGAGLPILAIGYGVFWLVRRIRRNLG